MENVDETYKELLFLSQKTEDQNLKLILIIHAINLSNSLICTGSLEDDPEAESSIILPPKWEIPIDSVYSMRYKKNDFIIYMKFIFEADIVDINVVSTENSGKILSCEIERNHFENHVKVKDIYSKEIINILLKKNQKIEKKSQNVENINDNFLWTQPRNIHNPFQNNPSIPISGINILFQLRKKY